MKKLEEKLSEYGDKFKNKKNNNENNFTENNQSIENLKKVDYEELMKYIKKLSASA